MGNEEADASAKASKPSATQEQPFPNNPAAVYPDWASFQAYYNAAGTAAVPPHGFYHPSAASSPQGHPYMWAPQHVIPPYGTPPPPYVAMYPHGGLYSHPSIPLGSHPYRPYAMPSSNGTVEGPVNTGYPNSFYANEKIIFPTGYGARGVELDGKANEIGKASGASGNGGVSQSGESGSEGSSEGSDANSLDDSGQKHSHERSCADGNANGSAAGGRASISVTGTPASHTAPLVAVPCTSVTGPTTTLNIGMDYWGGSSSSSVTPIRSKLPVKPAGSSIVPCSLSSSRDGVPSDLWLQDEREIKRQKRKQSNRESARRSRLRKQAECEELAQRVGTLKEENDMLREELERIKEECEKFASENASLNEKLKQLQGEDTRTGEDGNRPENNIDNTEKDK